MDPRTARRLIVNADDFGLNRSVTDGIIRAFRQGCVTSTSVMVVGGAAQLDHAADRLRANPGLDHGVHITLCSGPGGERHFPLDKGFRDLLRGRPWPEPSWRMLISYGRAGIAPVVRREMEQQVEAVLARGLIPTHINSHCYVADIPALMRIMVEVAGRYGIPAVRWSRERLRWRHAARWGSLPKMAMLNWFGARNARTIRDSGLVTSDHYLGAFDSGRLSESRMARMICELQPGLSELVVHPAQRDSPRHREAGELAALTSARIRAIIRSERVALTSFRKVLHEDPARR